MRLRRRSVCASALWSKFSKRRKLGDGQRSSDEGQQRLLPTPARKQPGGSLGPGDAEVGDIAEAVPEVEAATLAAKPPRPKRQVALLPSVFEGRPPVVFFSYTEACGAAQRPLGRSLRVPIETEGRLYYGHTDAVHEYNAVINALRQGGLYRIRSESRVWSLLWGSHPKPEVLRVMKSHQRTNHFPGSWHLGRKDLLWQNIARMQRQHGNAFQITPQGYILPKAWGVWEGARKRQPDAYWIWKPCSSSCGKGIRVVSSQLSEQDQKEFQRKRGIVQRYIANPLCIDGYKFDLRIYVVVSSFDPLKVYINDEGLVRLATQKYSNDKASLACRTMHLTNYSVNKASPKFKQNTDEKARGAPVHVSLRGSAAGQEAASPPCAAEKEEEEEDEDEEEVGAIASKWSLTELRAFFADHGLDYEGAFGGIKDLVIKTLLAAEPQIRATWNTALQEHEDGPIPRRRSHMSSCFEIYGFDVMIDSDMKPWLLEVNICPSLSSGSALDKRIKTKLVADALTLVGVPAPFRWSGLDAAGLKEVRQSSRGGADDDDGMDEEEEGMVDEDLPAPEELAQRAAKLSELSGADAVAQFDELAWDIVLNAHDEDMRRGSLERIFPEPNAAKYAPFFSEETYFNVVLQKWQEAGGADVFRPGRRPPPPPWVPRQVSFQVT